MRISLVIDRLENDWAVLVGEGITVNWPKTKLPLEVKEGAVLVFEINTDQTVAEEKTAQARDLLNEILKA